MFHSSQLQALTELQRQAEALRHELPSAPHIHGMPFPLMAFADNCQMCVSKPLPSRGEVKRMGRAPFMDVSGMTSIIGLAALNGSTDDAFIEASLWETNVYQVI